MNKRDEYVAQMQAKLDEWNAAIDELEAKARKQQAQASQTFQQRIAELKTKRDEATAKLQEVQDASQDAWQSLKAGTEKIWDDVKQTFHETSKAFSD